VPGPAAGPALAAAPASLPGPAQAPAASSMVGVEVPYSNLGQERQLVTIHSSLVAHGGVWDRCAPLDAAWLRCSSVQACQQRAVHVQARWCCSGSLSSA